MPTKTYSVTVTSHGRITTRVEIDGEQIEPPPVAVPPTFTTRCEPADGGTTCIKHVFDGANEVYSYKVNSPCPPAGSCTPY